MSRLIVITGILVIVLVLGLLGSTVLLARASERDHPPVGATMTIDGLTVHVRDSGQRALDPADADADADADFDAGADAAPVILLLHGASTSLLDFETSLFPALSTDHRVISIDRPGHGYSDAPAEWPSPYTQAAIARATLTALGIEQAVWVGHSLAGSIVMAGLLEESSGISAGVLLAGATHPWDTGVTWHADVAALPVIGKVFSWLLIEPVGHLMLDSAVASVFTPETAPPDYVVETGVRLSLRPDTFRANARDLTHLSEHLDAQALRYPTIDRPILSLTADGDDVVPAWNHDERLRKVLPTVQSSEFKGAGHAFHHTRTEEVADAIREFIGALSN